MFRKLTRWLPAMSRNQSRKQPARRCLALETLEAREVPANFLTWVGGNGALWSTPANWNTNAMPSSGDSVNFPANVVSTQDVLGLSVNRVVLAGGDTILLNQPLTLNGAGLGDQVTASGASNSFAGAAGLNMASGERVDFDVMPNSTLFISTKMFGTSGVEKIGTGTLEFDNNASYSGSTNVDDGVLALNDNVTLNSALPSTFLQIGDGSGGSAEVRLLQQGQIPNDAPVTIRSDGKLNLNGFTESIGDLTMHDGIVTTANGNLTVNGNVFATGTPSIVQGSTAGVLNLPAGNHTFDIGNSGDFLFITTQITGPGGVTKTGQGTLSYQNALAASPNSYTGDTFVKDGGLTLQDAAANSAFQGNLVIGDGAGLPGTAFVRLNANSEIPDAKSIMIDFDGKFDLNGFSDVVGPLSINGGGSIQNTGAGILGLNGNVTMPASVNAQATINSNVNLGSTSHTITINNPILGMIVNGQITGTGGIFKNGVGTLELQGAINAPNTFTGQTRVGSGVLFLNHNSFEAVSTSVGVGDGSGAPGDAILRLGQNDEIPDTANVTVFDDGLLDLNNHSDLIANLTLDIGASVTTGTGTLSLGGNVEVDGGSGTTTTISGKLDLGNADRTFNILVVAGHDLEVDAVISGSGGLIKTGFGDMVLNGANTYTGATTVQGGGLLINGSQPSSAVTVQSGALGGSGSVGSVTGNSGGVIPCADFNTLTSPRILSTKSLALDGSSFNVQIIGKANGQFGQAKVVGTVNINGSTLVSTLNYSSQLGNVYTIIVNDGADAVTGTFTGLAEGTTFALGTRTFQITYHGNDGNDVVLTDRTPEPYAIGADAGGAAIANVFNPDGSPKASLQAFEATFSGGVRTAMGDVTGDGIPDIIAGCGPGRSAEVRIFDGVTNQQITSIPVFEGFTGGVFVTTGDFNHDGHSDIVVTPDQGGGPRVSIFSGADGSQMANFFGITDPNFRGGARTAVGDMNGDGTPDLYVSAGFGGGPRVTAFDGTTLSNGLPTKLFNDIFAFEQGLRNGVYLAAGDIDGDGKTDLIAGGGPGGGPRLYGLSGADLLNGMGDASQVLANFFGGNTNSRGGIRVVAKNLDGDGISDIVIGDGEGAGSQVTSYFGKNIPVGGGTPAVADQFNAYPGFAGGVFVG